MCFICTSPLASSGQLVLAIDVIVKIKICLQLSPQIVYNCSPDFNIIFFILVCWEMFAKNHQELFPNCHDHQELFTNYHSKKFAKISPGIVSKLSPGVVDKDILQAVLEKCPSVLLLQLETGCNSGCEALQFLIGSRKKHVHGKKVLYVAAL